MIRFINVNKKFNDKVILENVNLDIPSGSVVGIMGVNGSGKSTLLRLIAGVIEADAGLVVINERNVFENVSVKQELFFLSDDPYIFNQATMNDMRDFYKIFYPTFNDNVYLELAKVFELNPQVKIQDFSKGTKRQAALVLAIACQPKILLLDEAFDGLDPKKRFKLRQYLTEFLDIEESIIVISSHNLTELEGICDIIIMVENGCIKLNHQTVDYRALYHRFQVAFGESKKPDDFKFLNPLSIHGTDQIFSVIVKGDKQEIESSIQVMKPLILEHHFLTLEDIFMYESEGEQS